MAGRAQAASARPHDARRSQRTSGAVLEAAVTEFAERGFAGARIDRIAALAGVNKQALYYHFGNKDALFAAALEFGYAQFRLRGQTRPAAGGSVVAELARLIGALFDSTHANRLHASLIADENRHHGKHLSPELHARIRRLIAPVIGEMTALIDRGADEGVLRAGLDGTHVYLSVISLSMFYLTNATTLAATVGLDLSQAEAVARWRAHVIDFVMAALRSGSAAAKADGGGDRD
jgi:AcrR family transcriptional regulator